MPLCCEIDLLILNLIKNKFKKFRNKKSEKDELTKGEEEGYDLFVVFSLA
jgi:hypothetical protein